MVMLSVKLPDDGMIELKQGRKAANWQVQEGTFLLPEDEDNMLGATLD
jgi:hypothetical protein